MSVRKLAIAAFSALLAYFSLNTFAGPTTQAPVQYSHSLESDEDDARELGTLATRKQASQAVGWRDEKSAHDPLVHVKLLGINDLHGRLDTGLLVAGRPVGGISILASYLKTAAAQARDGHLIIHAGDLVGASPPDSALLQDEPTIQFMNQLANRNCRHTDPRRVPWPVLTVDQPLCNVIGTLGNHEFDEGIDEMLRLIGGGNHKNGPFLESPYRGARFSYVSANVVKKSNGQPFLPPFVVRLVGGQPIGIIGAVLKETPTIVTPTGVAGANFLDEADSINTYARFLNALGVRTIVVTIHQGMRQVPTYTGPTDPTITGLTGANVDIVRRLDSSVDVVISGHTHQFSNALINNNAGHPILVTQAFSSGTAYDDIDLAISRKSHDVVEKVGSVQTTWADEGPGLTPDADAAALANAADTVTGPLVNRVVGVAPEAIDRTESPAGESTMGNLIADAQRIRSGTQFAFMNPGGIRENLNAGTVTWGELFTIQPFSNDLVSMDLTGAQIKTLLEQQWVGQPSPKILKTSGIWYRWQACPGYNPGVTPFCASGQPQILEMRAGGPTGALIDPTATYRVTVNSFMATGGDNYLILPSGLNRVVGFVDLAALVDYVEQDLAGNVVSHIEGRIERVN
jgi:5'-nucleotidase